LSCTYVLDCNRGTNKPSDDDDDNDDDDDDRLEVPYFKLSTIGGRAFLVSASQIWH